MARIFNVLRLGLFQRYGTASERPGGVISSWTATDVQMFSSEEILRRLQTSKDGLAQSEAESRLESSGPNEVVHGLGKQPSD